MYFPKPASAIISENVVIRVQTANTPNASGARIRAIIIVDNGVINFTPSSERVDHFIELNITDSIVALPSSAYCTPSCEVELRLEISDDNPKRTRRVRMVMGENA